ncbi:hypothetical protein O181_073336 [Austropuccinia psidii MF-1]|uniref:Integrase catalytic domain-containing protein n=1 Tax=Austropuccinia psidii MF-1 TaxID=1389203 RepID=A0A9Q3I869_9BASI|nr:hypothetical protein [Austropuccinia psidii MF-1]
MDWVTEVAPGCEKGYNSFLVISHRYIKLPRFLPHHKDDPAIDTALLLWNRVISHKGLFKNIISERDPKFTSALWTNIHRFFGTNLLFATAYYSKADGVEERMIKALEDMMRRVCAYGLEFKDSNFFTHDWFTVIPALELVYKTSIHSLIGNTSVVLKKGWNPKLPEDTLRKDFIDINPTSSRLNLTLDKVKHHQENNE